MSKKIEQFITAKDEYEKCRKWAALIGDRYHGGGGGVGELRSVTLAGGEASPTVYHQYNNGSKNYHHMPSGLRNHMESAIKDKFPELLSEALARQSSELAGMAVEAIKEHASLMDAAGLSTLNTAKESS